MASVHLGLEEDVLHLLDGQSLQQASLHSVEGVIWNSLHLSITWSRIFSVKWPPAGDQTAALLRNQRLLLKLALGESEPGRRSIAEKQVGRITDFSFCCWASPCLDWNRRSCRKMKTTAKTATKMARNVKGHHCCESKKSMIEVYWVYLILTPARLDMNWRWHYFAFGT